MFNSFYQLDEQKDVCEICEEQSAYINALALDYACMQIGK